MRGKLEKEALIRKYSGRQDALETNKPVGPRIGGRPGGGPGGGPQGRGIAMSGSKPKNAGASIKRLFAYVRGEELRFVLALLLLAINTGSTLAGSYVLRPIINNLMDTSVSVADRTQNLIMGLFTMSLIYISGIFAVYGQSRIMLSISQKALQRIRDDLFRKMQKLPIRFFDGHSHGELMSRFTNDVDTIGEMLNNTVVNLFSGAVTVIGVIALMFYTNWKLALVTMFMIPVLMKGGTMVASKSRRYYKGQQTALGAANGYIEEMVTGQKVVKVFCHEERAMEEFEVLSDHLQEQQMNAQFFGGIMGPVVGNLSQVGYSIIVTVGGILCFLNRFDVGGLTIFAHYFRQFGRPLNEISMQVNTIFAALAGAERVFEVMDELPEAEDGESSVELKNPKGFVRLTDVTFGYQPDKMVLNKVSCYAKPGQKIAFVGSTGAGKTTITNLINRFYDVKEGRITIDDVDIMDVKRDDLRSNVAMVLQDTHLFTGTIMENIRYGRLDATDEEVVEAAKMASAHHFIKRLEKGYDTMIEGDGGNLSQGQRQLLNIARAAVSKAPILILDEATSSVDTRTEKHIEHGMDRLMAERTTFVIAHRLSTVRDSNAIMVLEHGEIIERGTHDELLERKGRYYELYTGLVELA